MTELERVCRAILADASAYHWHGPLRAALDAGATTDAEIAEVCRNCGCQEIDRDFLTSKAKGSA